MRNAKLTGIFLISCLIAPIIVTTLWYEEARHEVRKQVKRQLMAGRFRKELDVLSFGKQEAKKMLRWEDESEFEFRDTMYDVVSSSTSSDSVHYLCLPDSRETRLNHEMKRLVSIALGNNPMNRENQQRLDDFLRNLFPPETTMSKIIPISNHQWEITSAPGLHSRAVKVDLPPPERT